jgi:erythromycin esterase-like protein
MSGLSLLFAAAAAAQCAPEDALAKMGRDRATAAWLRTAATPLDNEKPMLARIAEIAGDAQVVGFGEPDHGWHEFPELRNAVFEMLVEEKDFRAITLETGMLEARLVDRYVVDVDSKTGITLDEVLAKGFTHDMGEWDETAELVSWVRTHNEEAAKAGKPLVRWGGKDLSVRGDTLAVPVTELAALFAKVGQGARLRRLASLADKSGEVVSFVEKVLREKAHIDAIDPDHLDAVCSLSYDQLSDEERAAVAAELSNLDKDLNGGGGAGVAGMTAEDLESARLLVAAARQMQEDLEYRMKLGVVYGPTNSGGMTIAFLRKVYAAAGKPVPAGAHVKFIERNFTPEELKTYELGRRIREEHLAANVAALRRKFGKTFDFSASSHLQKASGLADAGFSAAEGQFLAERFGKGYVVIGGTASAFENEADTGEPRHDEPLRAMRAFRSEQTARPDSFESRFEVTASSGLLVDFRKDPSCRRPRWIDRWLGTPQLTWIGPMKFNFVPKRSYDAAYWIRRATPGRRRAPRDADSLPK